MCYAPQPALRTFLDRAQTQENSLAQVTAAVLDARESERLFGVPLARRGIQPVFLRVVNRGTAPLRLHLVGIDPNYYTPLEAAAVNHFSFAKRISAFGLIAWLFMPLLAIIIPFKLFSCLEGQPADGRLLSIAVVSPAADPARRAVGRICVHAD